MACRDCRAALVKGRNELVDYQTWRPHLAGSRTEYTIGHIPQHVQSQELTRLVTTNPSMR